MIPGISIVTRNCLPSSTISHEVSGIFGNLGKEISGNDVKDLSLV
ncbi:MAG: hypothetical protein PVJ16_05485 [Nitrosopumilaceae archaeon]